MKIKCTKCQKVFLQLGSERTCGCTAYKLFKKLHPNEMYDKSGRTLTVMRRFYQDPIHTWYKEFISTESMPQNRIILYPITYEYGWHDKLDF